jgi:hypothetical protein
MTFDIYLLHAKPFDTLKFKIIRNNKIMNINIVNYIFNDPQYPYYPAYENIPYFIFAGLVVQYKTYKLDIFNNYAIYKLNYLNDLQNIDHSSIYISFVYSISLNDKNNIFNQSIIDTINDIKICNMKDLQCALFKPIRKNKIDYLKIVNTDGNILIQTMKNIANKDINLSNKFNYSLDNKWLQFLKKYL